MPPHRYGLRRRVQAMFGGAVRQSCRDQGCGLGLGGLSDYIVLKGEDVLRGKKMCDCIIIHAVSPPRVVLVELKSGGVKQGQTLEKFSNAVDFLAQTEQDLFAGARYGVIMLLLIKRRKRKSFYAMWRTRQFVTGGKKRSVMTMPCGTRLADIYSMLSRAGDRARTG